MYRERKRESILLHYAMIFLKIYGGHDLCSEYSQVVLQHHNVIAAALVLYST